jgi:hypothetical protein
MQNLQRVLTAAVAVAALAGSAAPGQDTGTPAGLPPPVADWTTRDTTRLADPGQPLGAGPRPPTEPAALVPPPAAVLPSPVGPRTLDACVTIALENHPRISSARADVRAAQG